MRLSEVCLLALIDGKIVIINSFFATCTGVCPVMSGTYKKIQDALAKCRTSKQILVQPFLDAAAAGRNPLDDPKVQKARMADLVDTANDPQRARAFLLDSSMISGLRKSENIQ